MYPVILYLITFMLILGDIYLRSKKKDAILKNIPGPKGWPLIGNGLEFRGSLCDMLKTLTKHMDNHSVIKLWIGPKLLILLSDPKDIEVILNSREHIDKSSEYDLFKPWLGNGILISAGDTWRAQRKLIAPTFHLEVLKTFTELFNENSRETVEKLRKEGANTFDCHDYMSEATVEMLLETVMGINKETQNQSGYEYAKAVMKMCEILHIRHLKPWLKPNWIFKLTSYSRIQEQMLEIIHGLTRKIIQSKMESWDKQCQSRVQPIESKEVGLKMRIPFLDLLVEASKNDSRIANEEIRQQVDTIMLEGHDTTASAASFFLSLMAAHPEIQNRVLQELEEIFGDSDRHATFDDILQMKYLERCLLETLTLYPPVPIIARQINKPVQLVSGDYVLPAKSTVLIITLKVHRRGDIYPNPDQFDPDNFLPERTENRNYYAFIPFSAGPRNCIGRKYAFIKLKILLSTIVRNFYIRSHLSEKDFQLRGDIILKRKEGFKVRLEPRIKSNN